MVVGSFPMPNLRKFPPGTILAKLKQTWSWSDEFAWTVKRSDITGKRFWLRKVYKKEIMFRPFVNGPRPYASIAAKLYASKFARFNHYTIDLFEVLDNRAFTDEELKLLQKKVDLE